MPGDPQRAPARTLVTHDDAVDRQQMSCLHGQYRREGAVVERPRHLCGQPQRLLQRRHRRPGVAFAQDCVAPAVERSVVASRGVHGRASQVLVEPVGVLPEPGGATRAAVPADGLGVVGLSTACR